MPFDCLLPPPKVPSPSLRKAHKPQLGAMTGYPADSRPATDISKLLLFNEVAAITAARLPTIGEAGKRISPLYRSARWRKSAHVSMLYGYYVNVMQAALALAIPPGQARGINKVSGLHTGFVKLAALKRKTGLVKSDATARREA